MVYLIKHGFDPLDPATLTNPAAVFIQADHIETQADGSIAFAQAVGGPGAGAWYGGQEPMLYAVRNDNASVAAYQKFTQNGAIVTTQTRPGDPVFAYTLINGKSY